MATSRWDIGLEYPEKQWGDDPDLVVHVFPRGERYAVAVELLRDGDSLIVSGIAVRVAHMLSGGGPPDSLSPRDEVQRLPLRRITQAALAAAAKAPRDYAALIQESPRTRRGTDEWLRVRNRPDVLLYDDGDGGLSDAPTVQAARQRLKVPSGRPSRSAPAKSLKFYRDLLAKQQQLVEEGHPSPVKEIARRMGVPANRVHQWLFRARRLQQPSTEGDDHAS